MVLTTKHSNVHLGLFGGMCLVWGLTWIPIQVGASAMPPMVFATARGLAGGTILLGLSWCRHRAWRIELKDLPRLLTVGTVAFAAAYSLLFWGTTRLDSGVAAVVNLSLVPTSLLVIGALMGEEQFRLRKAVPLTLGVAGLGLLYMSSIRNTDTVVSGHGIAAIVVATLCFSYGTILARELLRRYSPLLISGGTMLTGAAVLLLVNVVAAPQSLAAASELRRPEVALSLAFLVIFASVFAFTSYLRLARDWEPSRAGYYAFVSPVIAVLAGVWIMDESLTPLEVVGMGLMLSGTVIAIRQGKEPATHENRPDQQLQPAPCGDRNWVVDVRKRNPPA